MSIDKKRLKDIDKLVVSNWKQMKNQDEPVRPPSRSGILQQTQQDVLIYGQFAVRQTIGVDGQINFERVHPTHYYTDANNNNIQYVLQTGTEVQRLQNSMQMMEVPRVNVPAMLAPGEVVMPGSIAVRVEQVSQLAAAGLLTYADAGQLLNRIDFSMSGNDETSND
jgi:hypothetical protein